MCHTDNVSKNLSRRAHVGKRGRSAFFAEIACDEIMRRNQQDALTKAAGAWEDQDHPELQQGAAAWVRRTRAEPELTVLTDNRKHLPMRELQLLPLP